MKPGVQTTEFWLTMIATLVSGYAAVYGQFHGTETKTYVICMAAVNAIYILSRAITKAFSQGK